MKKFLTLFFVVILLFCAFNVVSVYALKPETDSFRLSVSLSASECEVGDEVNIYADIKNATAFSRIVKYSGSLITIAVLPEGEEPNIVEAEDEKSAFVFMFCGKDASDVFTAEQAGVYNVYIFCSFESNGVAISQQQTAKLTVNPASVDTPDIE